MSQSVDYVFVWYVQKGNLKRTSQKAQKLPVFHHKKRT